VIANRLRHRGESGRSESLLHIRDGETRGRSAVRGDTPIRVPLQVRRIGVEAGNIGPDLRRRNSHDGHQRVKFVPALMKSVVNVGAKDHHLVAVCESAERRVADISVVDYWIAKIQKPTA